MVQINTELMLQRRIQLGWTAEQLAAESGLDARTIRRLEQGKTRARLHTAVAVAQALTLDTSAFVLNEGASAGKGSSADERDADEDSVAAAFKAADNTFQTEVTTEGDQSFREVMYVLSLLLTRALATEGKGLAEQEDAGVHEVVAAFKAADVAIRTTLSGRGELGIDEATCVLSLLLTRYGIAFSRRPEHGPIAGFNMIRVAADQARKALSDRVPGYPGRGLGEPVYGETIIAGPMFDARTQEMLDKWPYYPRTPPEWPTGLSIEYVGTPGEEKSDKDRSDPKVQKSRDKL